MTEKVLLSESQLMTLTKLLEQKTVHQIAEETNKSYMCIHNHFNKIASKKLITWKDGKWHRTEVEIKVVSEKKLYGKEWRRQHDIRWEERLKKIKKAEQNLLKEING